MEEMWGQFYVGALLEMLTSRLCIDTPDAPTTY